MVEPEHRGAKAPPPLFRIVALLCWGLLFFGQMWWWGWLAPPPPVPRAFLIVVTAGPLLLPFRGLLYDRVRAYFWLNVLLLGYFSLGVAAVWASRGQNAFAWGEVIVAVAGFVAAFCRSRQLAS